MRIIDKQRDYYDYLQDPTDTLVFDRTGSYILTKEMMCKEMSRTIRYRSSKFRFILLQCGASFWLMLATVKEDTQLWGNKEIVDYTLELLASWKNYNKSNELLKIYLVYVNHRFNSWDYKTNDFVKEKLFENSNILKDSIDHNDYKIEKEIIYIKHTDYKNGWKSEACTYPILKASGISGLIDPLDMFCAIEEYFSREKTAAEKTEPIGATNNDKIIMHGFDTKTSFRGK